MIINCVECKEPISDKAYICPHCGIGVNVVTGGAPLEKRFKLPNGFGQISKIKNRNLRKPYRVMVTVDKDENGVPIVKPLKPNSYFATYNEAYIALVKYNESPYDISVDISVAKLYEMWFNNYIAKQNQSKSTIACISSTWKYCSLLYDFPVRDIRSRHIRLLIDNAAKDQKTASAYMKTRIKSLLNILLDYAVEYELTDRNYCRNVRLNNQIYLEVEEQHRGHIPFTGREITALWENVDKIPYTNIIIIQCYTGFRPSELGLIRLENVDLKRQTITGGIKTEAGRDRIVPIHPRILPFVIDLYNEATRLNSEYLINCTDGNIAKSGLTMTYERYRLRFNKVMNALRLNPSHLPHDPRKHFVTAAKKSAVDEYAIKYIVGHAITDITEKVYTKRDLSWLKREIKKIK